jgi:PIN domain nuclease of toxin-antitoxin system
LRLLLDTQALLWFLVDHPALTATAKAAIEDSNNEIFSSGVSAWEIATKHRSGKLPLADAFAANLSEVILGRFVELPITVRHGQLAGQLPDHHRDPFDRMLIAQALEEKLVLISNERLFDAYGVGRLW